MGAPTPYLVLDVGDKGATIRDAASKQDIHVPKLDPAEWNDVPVAPTAPDGTPHHDTGGTGWRKFPMIKGLTLRTFLLKNL